MKAEDTVMSWEGIRIVLQEQDKKGQHDNMFRLEAIAQAQAEITWDLAFKAGIKEVVEWMKTYATYPHTIEQWQAKLKEWE